MSKMRHNNCNDQAAKFNPKTDERSNPELNSLLADALIMACKIGFSDDCPLINMDYQPWDQACEEVCEKHIGNDWECWVQYFKTQVS